MAESPITVDWERLLTSENVQDYFGGQENDEEYEDDAEVYEDGRSPQAIQTPRSNDPPQSEAQTMFTAIESPEETQVPSDISFPSIHPEPVINANGQQRDTPPVYPNMQSKVRFQTTPKTTNIHYQHITNTISTSTRSVASTRSSRSKDPPEENYNINQSSALLSYSQNTYNNPAMEIQPSTTSIASQSTISTQNQQPAPTAPTYTTPNYATTSSLQQLRNELRQEIQQELQSLHTETSDKLQIMGSNI